MPRPVSQYFSLPFNRHCIRSRPFFRIYLSNCIMDFYCFFSGQLLPTVNNDLHISRVQLNHPAGTAILLTSQKRCTGAAEWVVYNSFLRTAVADQPVKQLDWLHGRVLLTTDRPVIIKNCALSPSASPVVGRAIVPSVQAWLVFPLVVLTPKRKMVFVPYKDLTDCPSNSLHCFEKFFPLIVCMPNVESSARRH